LKVVQFAFFSLFNMLHFNKTACQRTTHE